MPSRHVVASGVASAIFLSFTKSIPGTAACFFAGILIDLDHAFDFVVIKKKMYRSFKELKTFCASRDDKKIYLWLHSYEVLAVLWALAFIFGASPVYAGILWGMTIHLFLDQLTNPIHPLSYFLVYRIKLGFPKDIFFVERQPQSWVG